MAPKAFKRPRTSTDSSSGDSEIPYRAKTASTASPTPSPAPQPQLPAANTPTNGWILIDGSGDLPRVLPGHLFNQIGGAGGGQNKPSCARPVDRRKSRTNFTVAGTSERLMTGYYACGTVEIVVVQQRATKPGDQLLSYGMPFIVVAKKPMERADNPDGTKSMIWNEWQQGDNGPLPANAKREIVHKALARDMPATNDATDTADGNDADDDAQPKPRKRRAGFLKTKPSTNAGVQAPKKRAATALASPSPPPTTTKESRKYVFKKSEDEAGGRAIPASRITTARQLFEEAFCAGIIDSRGVGLRLFFDEVFEKRLSRNYDQDWIDIMAAFIASEGDVVVYPVKFE